MTLKKYILLIAFLLLKTANASAQYTLSIREELVTKEITTLWNINLAYIGAKETEELQVKLSLQNANDKTIYEVLSPYILLNNKDVKQLNTGFTIAQTIVNELNTNFLPDGRYEVVYRENRSNRLLRRRHFTVSGERISFTTQADSSMSDVKKWISTTGSARLTSAFNSPQGLQSEQKNYYSRFEFNPTLVLGGQVPITAAVLLTTEQNEHNQSMNQFSIGFDYNYFKTLQEQRAMAKIEELKGGAGLADMNLLKDKFIQEKHKGYDELKATLNSPEAQEQLSKAEEYNSLEQQTANLEKEIDRNKMKDLQKKHGVSTLLELEEKKSQIPEKDYNELKFQMTTSVAHEDALKQMKQLEGAKENAKKLQKQKETLDRIENTDYTAMMRDPQYNKAILGKLGMNNPTTKLMGSIRNFNIGTSYPLYTELTLNGVRSTGFNIELNPGLFYMAFTKGTILEQRFDTILNTYEFQQKVLAGRLGLGKKNGSYIILSYLNTAEQGDAFTSAREGITYNPGNNLIAGVDMQLSLFKKKFVTQLEINDAFTTTDINAPAMPNTGDATFDRLSKLVSKVHYQTNMTTRMDYAYTAKSEMRLLKDNTVISGSYSYIGPGYKSYTAPYLLTDLMKYEGKLSQSFWKKRFTAGGFYKYMTDDIFNSKSFQTSISGYGAEATINIPKIPSFWAKYLPVNQVSDFRAISGTVGKLASNMTMAGSSYAYNFSNVSCNTTAVFSLYDIKDEYWGTDIQMNTYTISHIVAFKDGMNWSVNGFYNTSNDPRTADQRGYSLSETSILKKKVTAGFEVHYLTQGINASKTGAMITMGVKLLKSINTQLKVTFNSIESTHFGNRFETYGLLVVGMVW